MVDRDPGVGQRRGRPGPVFQLAGVVARPAPEGQPLAKPARLQHVAQRLGHVARAAEGDLFPVSSCGTPRRGPARSEPGCTRRDNASGKDFHSVQRSVMRHSLGKTERSDASPAKLHAFCDKTTRRDCARKVEAQTTLSTTCVCHADDGSPQCQNARPGSTSTFGFAGSVVLDTTTDGVSLISTS